MTGRGEPPDGPPDNTPEGFPGDDEYRSMVFDDSFVRAARLKELSARERMSDHARAVRSMPARALPSGPRQLITLLVLVTLAFGTAVYFGFRNPYRVPSPRTDVPQLRTAVVPLAPAGAVPGGTAADLFAHSPAAHFGTGPDAVVPPPAAGTPHFSQGEVRAALQIAKDYLDVSSFDLTVLTGQDPQAVRGLLDPAQTGQFDRSFTGPPAPDAADPAGWLVSFDRGRVTPEPGVRVRGSFSYDEAADRTLEVVSDHVFVYALTPAAHEGATSAAGAVKASLFTVRRHLRFRFDEQDLAEHQVQLVDSEEWAGPQACSPVVPTTLRPLLAGERPPAGAPAGTDPFAAGTAGTPGMALCGMLSESAEPRPAH